MYVCGGREEGGEEGKEGEGEEGKEEEREKGGEEERKRGREGERKRESRVDEGRTKELPDCGRRRAPLTCTTSSGMLRSYIFLMASAVM